jgi:D-aspartate ligase
MYPLPMIAGKTPALLLMAEYNGTLAAARCLSDHGVRVSVATSSLLAPSRWSNAVGTVESCPGFAAGPARVAKWLIGFGRSNEKHVLYPTCDEMAWLIAHYHSELLPHFHLYSPGGGTLQTLLDKRQLYAAATAVGLATPTTWYPQGEGELAAMLKQVNSCLVKPRAQTFFSSRAKGGHAATLPQLTQLWRQYKASGFPADVTQQIPDLDFPMVQEYLPEAAGGLRSDGGVLSISGFVIRSGRIIDTRASRKVLQSPPRAGVGLGFESAEVDPHLVELLSSLCRSTGYHGVFEAEFIHHDGKDLLIDFNPRYFGQMAFDIARGMQLPWLAQLCATGDEEAAQRLTGASAATMGPAYFADSLTLRWHLATRTLFGRVSSAERRQWLSWLESRPDRFADAVLRPGDARPAIAAATERLWHSIRHPRGFWRSVRAAPPTPAPCVDE